MKIEELILDYQNHISDLVDLRKKNEEKGYEWVYKGIKYDDTLDLLAFQKFFDRKEQNDEYVKRYKETSVPDKLPTAMLQNEINMIYSFHKCFAMRNHTRLQYYRNDLSQKGHRIKSMLHTAMGYYLQYRDQIEKKT